MLEIAFDQNNDGMINDEEATFYLSGHESYDQETFVNTGWLLMKQLFSKFENANKNDNIEDADTKKDEFSDDSVDDYDDYDVDEMDETHPNDNDEDEEPDVPENWDDVDRESAPNDETAEEKPKSQYPPEVQALVDSATVARTEYDTANNAYNDLKYDIEVYTYVLKSNIFQKHQIDYRHFSLFLKIILQT